MGKAHRNWIVAAIAVFSVAMAAAAALCFWKPVQKAEPRSAAQVAYGQAQLHLQNGEYTQAYYQLLKCREFENSKDILKDFYLLYESSEMSIEMHYGEDKGTKSTSRTERRYTNTGKQTLVASYDEAGKLICKTVWEYNADGEQILHAFYDAEGKLTYKTVREFDDNGKQTLSASYGENGVLQYKSVYEYDKKGFLIAYASYEGEELSYRRTYENDKYGNPVLTTYISAAGLTEETKYANTYDANGNLIQCVCTTADGERQIREIYTYDDAGNKIRYARHDANGQPYEICEYNAQGLQTLHVQYTSGKMLERKIWEFNEKGNLLLRARYGENGGMDYKYQYAYDAEGDRTMYIEYGKNGRFAYKEIYQLDEEGNCIYSTRQDADGTETHWRSGEFTYDKYGIPLKETYYNEDGQVRHEITLSQDYQTRETKIYSYATDAETGESYVSSLRTEKQTGLVIAYQPEEDK